MSKLTLILLSFFFLFSQSVFCCVCPSNYNSFDSLSYPQDLSISSDDELIGGITYGRLAYVNKLIFLTKDVAISSSTGVLSTQCPTGYRPPTVDEYTKILATYQNQSYQILTGKLSYNSSLSYMTSNKTYPNITSGSDGNAWVYQCLILNSKTNITSITSCNSYWGKATQRVKCIQDLTVKRNIQTAGFPSQDMFPGIAYTLFVNNTNVLSYSWNFINEPLTSTNKTVVLRPKTDGCKALVLRVTLFGGIGLGNCIQYFVTTQYPNAPNKTDLYELSPESEVIGGVNVGRLIALNGKIWMMFDVSSGSTTGATIPSQCPANYRPPTFDELNNTLNNLGAFNYYTLSRVANYSASWLYVTNSKSYPNGTGDQTYFFKTIIVDNKTNSILYKDSHSYWDNKNYRIKCVRNSVTNDFSIKGQPISDLGVGQNYTFTVMQTNALSFVWNLGVDGGIKKTASVVYTPQTMGRKLICVNVTIFGGNQKSKCIEFYVQSSGGDSGNGAIVQVSPEDEIYDGVNYGKLLKFGGLLWLQQDASVQKSSPNLISSCPKGFGAPSQNLFNSILSSLADVAFYTLTRQAFYNTSFNYLSSNQTNVSATGVDSYTFQGIQFSLNPNKVGPVSINTYWSAASCRVKCLLSDPTVLNLYIKGLPFDNLEVGLMYQWEVVRSNVISYKWDLGNGTKSNSNLVVFYADKEEQRTICVNVSVNGWLNLSRCFTVKVRKTFQNSRDRLQIVTFSKDILVSAEDEVIQGQNYGRLIQVGTQLWLSKDLKVSSSINSLNVQCPIGYRLPTQDEYLNLVGILGSNASQILLNQLGLNQSLSYMTSTKSYPRVGGNGGDNNDWVFKGLYFSGSVVRVGDVSTYWSPELKVARCIMNNFNTPFEIYGLPTLDLYIGRNYNFSLLTTNTLNYSWKIGNSTSSQKSFIFSAQQLGKNIICTNVTIFGGFIKSYCQNVFVIINYNKDVNTSLTQTQYRNYSIPNIKIVPSGSLHFSSASSPLAPNDNGNSYLLYSQAQLNFLNVIELNPNGSIIDGSQCNLTRKGKPLDLIATPWGYAAYIRYNSNSKSSVIGMYKNCTVRFEKTIMNNENGTGTPLVPIEQVMFYDSIDNTSQPFGMTTMYNPHNGRLSYARERLGLIFAHYNHFGVKADGSNNDHTGSTFISLDEITGEDVKLGFSWGCSHSLNQANIWDGEKFITASLGDAYPMGIVVTKCEGIVSNGWTEPLTGKANRLDCSGSSGLISGKIPGNGWGDAAGRLGGLVILNDTDYAMVYSRRSSNVSFQNTPPPVVNTINEIGMVVFNKSYIVKNNFSVADGSFNNLLHVARYGQNILIGYSISNCTKGDGNFVCPSITKDEKNFLKLIDLNGNNLGEIRIKSLPGPDDFEVLADGRVAWVTYEADNSLTYHYLTPPGK